jgi:hypothetical protein
MLLDMLQAMGGRAIQGAGWGGLGDGSEGAGPVAARHPKTLKQNPKAQKPKSLKA